MWHPVSNTPLAYCYFAQHTFSEATPPKNTFSTDFNVATVGAQRDPYSHRVRALRNQVVDLTNAGCLA
jgi:hypothetical protein